MRNLTSQVNSQASGLVDLFFRDQNKVALKTADVLSDIINQSSSSEIIIGHIRDTEAANFVISDKFQSAVVKAFGVSVEDLVNPNSRAYKFLNNVDGIWGDVSEAYARSSSGNVVTLTGNGSSGGIWGLRELPALLDNPNVDSIDGLSRPALKQCLAMI